MNKLKSLVAVSAILLSATVVSAALNPTVPTATGVTGPKANGSAPITFAVTVPITQTLTVTDNGLGAGIYVTGWTVGTPIAASDANTAIAGYLDIATNLPSWDIWMRTANGGYLGNLATMPNAGTAVAAGNRLRCADAVGATADVQLSFFGCLDNASGSNCGSATKYPLPVSNAAAGTALSTIMNGGNKFLQSDLATGEARVHIMAGIPCDAAHLAPATTINANPYVEAISFVLTAGW